MPRWQYQALAEPLSEAPERTTIDKWLGSAPAIIFRQKIVPVAVLATTFFSIDPKQLTLKERTTPDKWGPCAPVRLDKQNYKIGLPPYLHPAQSPIDTKQLILPERPTPDKWGPSYPDRINRLKQCADQDWQVVNPLPLGNPAPSVDGWQGSAPSYINRLRRVAETLFVVDAKLFTQPERVSLDKWQPAYPDKISRLKQCADPDWWTIDPLPRSEAVSVDKWNGQKPDLLFRIRRVAEQAQIAEPIQTAAAALANVGWYPDYPNLIRRVITGRQGDFWRTPFVPVEIITSDKWTGCQPSRFPRRHQIITQWYCADPTLVPIPPVPHTLILTSEGVAGDGISMGGVGDGAALAGSIDASFSGFGDGAVLSGGLLIEAEGGGIA